MRISHPKSYLLEAFWSCFRSLQFDQIWNLPNIIFWFAPNNLWFSSWWLNRPNRDENQKKLKPPPRTCVFFAHYFLQVISTYPSSLYNMSGSTTFCGSQVYYWLRDSVLITWQTGGAKKSSHTLWQPSRIQWYRRVKIQLTTPEN